MNIQVRFMETKKLTKQPTKQKSKPTKKIIKIAGLKCLIEIHENENNWSEMESCCIKLLGLIPQDIETIKKLMHCYSKLHNRKNTIKYCFIAAYLNDWECIGYIRNIFKNAQQLKNFLLEIENPTEIILDEIEQIENDLEAINEKYQF